MKPTVIRFTLAPVLACLLLPCAHGQGSLVAWGSSSTGVVGQVPTGSDFIEVDGHWNAVALRADGSLVSWGSEVSAGQVTNTPLGTGFVDVDAGYLHNLAMRADGSIVSWGSNTYGQVTGTPAGPGFLDASAGGYHSVALRADGSLVTWGNPWSGVVAGTPAGPGFMAVTAGLNFCVALRADGSIVAWGQDSGGVVSQLPAGSDFVAVSAGGTHAVALRADGSLASWGLDTSGVVSATPSGTGFVEVEAGYYHSMARRPDGSLVSWGGNPSGLVSATPTDTGFLDIAAGNYFSIAIHPLNTPPVADADGPYLVAANGWVTFDSTGSYDPDGDPLTETWTVADNGTGSVSAAAYTASTQPGIYIATLTVSDGQASATDTTSVVVYDPSGGFVTGGGWFNSPAGAYLPDPLLSGKSSFGFVSKYKKGASVPDGATQFRFSAGDLDFHSTNYEWLVVNKGSSAAQFKGMGTINGGGDFRFMIWAGDGGPDTIRIRIWWEDPTGIEVDVYDNGAAQAIDGGSIVIHGG